jgi:hypothetical protein
MSPLGNCPGCGGDQPFEQIHPVGCPDADGGECQEWACTECGAGVIAGLIQAAAPTAGAADTGAARQPARAA